MAGGCVLLCNGVIHNPQVGFSQAQTSRCEGTPRMARVRAFWRVWRPRPGLRMEAVFLEIEDSLAQCRVEMEGQMTVRVWVDGLQENVLGDLRPLERLVVR